MSRKLKEIIEQVERIAKDKTDGHISLVRFTTGWQAEYGSPWGKKWRGKNMPTLREALERLLDRNEHHTDTNR